MLKNFSIILPFLTCLTLACGTGETTTGGGGNDDDEDIFVDDNDDELFGIACSGELSLTGTFVPDQSVPATDGCQPSGTWAVNADVLDLGTCDNMDEAVGEYVYTVSVDSDTKEQTINYQGDDPENPANLKVSSAGSTCRGIFVHYIGLVELNVQPFLNGTDLSGTATYERFAE